MHDAAVPLNLTDATPADAKAVAQLHVRAWQVTYRGMLPDEHLDSLSIDERAAGYDFDNGPLTTVLAADTDELRGFITFGEAHDLPGTGQVYALYVDPTSWRCGAGGVLLRHAQDRLRRAGFDDAVLWVLAVNERARIFYAGQGWSPDDAKNRQRIGGRLVDEVRYRKRVV